MITPAKCRAARSLLGWSQEELAKSAKVVRKTLYNFESGVRMPRANNLSAIKAALEKAGIVFLADGDITSGGPGVRLKK